MNNSFSFQGPILLQRECDVGPNDTVDSIYKRFMYPEGITAMAEAVNMVAKETAPSIVQSEEGATYDDFLNKADLCRLKLDQSATDIHNFIRGLDSSPGAIITLDGKDNQTALSDHNVIAIERNTLDMMCEKIVSK